MGELSLPLIAARDVRLRGGLNRIASEKNDPGEVPQTLQVERMSWQWLLIVMGVPTHVVAQMSNMSWQWLIMAPVVGTLAAVDSSQRLALSKDQGLSPKLRDKVKL